VLDYKRLMEFARQKAKEEVELLYPEGDSRREKKEHELKNKYYKQYTTQSYYGPDEVKK